MTRIARNSVRLLFWSALLCAGIVHAELNEVQQRCRLECGRAHLTADTNSPGSRQYPPDRAVDVTHLRLDVTPDFKRRTVSGEATITFRPIGRAVRELSLDGQDLTLRSVNASHALEGYQATKEQVVITFREPIPPAEQASVTILYEAEPRRGLHFRTPEMGYREDETQVWTQGEPSEARHWYPSHDYPNEKFTSEVICRVPWGMIALSNGKLLSETPDPQSGLVAYRWLQDKPHVNYLVALVAGYFKRIEDRYRDIPLAFYTPPAEIDQAMNSFRDTPDMLAFFEKEIGVPYPWAKYDQVVVRDFMWGGMENTTLTTLTEHTLFTEATENIQSSQGLVAHELAHQWFGNLVTCKDWSQLWLNEGFATYYAQLYDGYRNGRDSMLYDLYHSAQGLIERADDTRAIVCRTYHDPEDMFRSNGHLIYAKGGWVLHMLRAQLGEELYRKSIRAYLERHQYGSVVTEDLNSVIEEFSGRSFDRFFDQWVYHGGIPALKVSYRWEEQSDLAKVSIEQTQIIGPEAMLFELPLTIRFKSGDRIEERQVRISEKHHDFFFPLESAPEIVRLDPELTLLAKIEFDIPSSMRDAQLKDETDMPGRLRAVETLGRDGDRSSIDALKRILNHDRFYGVRMAASNALRAIHTPDALAALCDSLEQADARVRHQVVGDIGAFYAGQAFEKMLQVAGSEANPDIVARAVQALAPYSGTGAHAVWMKLLESDSYRNSLAGAAVRALRAHDDPSWIEPLMKTLRTRRERFTSQDYAQGLQTIAYLARHEERKEKVRELLADHVDELNAVIRQAALDALGTLEDERAIPLLEGFAATSSENPDQKIAKRALQKLRDARAPSVELSELRDELLKLKTINQEFREEMDELKKKFEAVTEKKNAHGESEVSPEP